MSLSYECFSPLFLILLLLLLFFFFFFAGNFMPGGENGTIMKRSVPNEHNALRSLMDDPLRNFVPEFKRVVEQNGEGMYR